VPQSPYKTSLVVGAGLSIIAALLHVAAARRGLGSSASATEGGNRAFRLTGDRPALRASNLHHQGNAVLILTIWNPSSFSRLRTSRASRHGQNITTTEGHLMSAEDEVRKASTQFYAALNSMLNGDPQPLSDIWSHDPAVTTMHPTGGRQVGWNEVWQSWEQVAQGASEGKVELRDQLIRVIGDVAYEVGVECPEFSLGGERRSPARFG
jgi:hypothetical protein